ncbi:pyruvate, water dikinase regulatory protein [Idiomarina xiamenensis]|uniref:Putative phosphoenolpyruvate synthase regulatory protein n=1 Tax=Idiomarina xiamenensis 10-D-4 TaxID=740709 RepID=K2KG39_9GAMM|nr:pyruvate, water dikinase regulatory protein [Idiomarina xiamenensis]EKE86978.1 PEP synthetase regulatory protein [Idiomarina xiamenensis 10-D-4]
MRSVFYISDGTALTAEAFGNALLSMFPVTVEQRTIPFVDNEDKARQAVKRINEAHQASGLPPLVFHTFVDLNLQNIVINSEGVCFDFLQHYVQPVADQLQLAPQPRMSRTHGIRDDYSARIDAINFTLDNDDGSNISDYEQADIILVGVSRTGKTPTSLYLALQFGIKAANYPFTEDDGFESLKLPKSLKPYRHKIYGLTLDPQRLHEIRNSRREGSRYASLQQCRFEVAEVERLYRREAIPFIDSTQYSVEEIATKIIAETNLKRRHY